MYIKHNKSSTNWTLERGYETADPETFPYRVLGPGARAGLNIVLKLTDVDLDYMCRGLHAVNLLLILSLLSY